MTGLGPTIHALRRKMQFRRTNPIRDRSGIGENHRTNPISARAPNWLKLRNEANFT